MQHGPDNTQTLLDCVNARLQGTGVPRQQAVDRANALRAEINTRRGQPAARPQIDDLAVLDRCEGENGANTQAVIDCVNGRLQGAGIPRDEAVERANGLRDDLQARVDARAAEVRRQEEARQAAEAQRAAEAERQRQAEARRQQEADAERQRQAEAARQQDAEAERQRQAVAARDADMQALDLCEDRHGLDNTQVVIDCVNGRLQTLGVARATAVERANGLRSTLQDRAAANAAAEAARGPDDVAILDNCAARHGAGNTQTVIDCANARLQAAGVPRADAVDRANALRGVLAARTADGAPDSRIAEEVARRGVPELTEEQRRAARQAGDALDGRNVEAATRRGGGSVSEQTVDSGDVRSSAEDFRTGAVVTDEGGLSNVEKFALGALGALAVGTILNNRNRVVSNSGDRVVVQREDGDLQILKDDDTLLRQEGANVRTESFDDGSTRTIVTRDDGSQVITIRDASLRVLRRVLIQTDGSEYTLIDDTAEVAPVDVSQLPAAPLVSTRPSTRAGDDPLREALRREAGIDRRFSLSQVRNIAQVRALAPAFEVESVTFASGSAAITPEQAGNLTGLAREVLDLIRDNPREVFLVEGHTDAVGDAAYNLALSDRRAETLALALNEYFGVPVENMVVQGYGEEFLLIPTLEDERANRRATVRQITGLLQTAAAN
ncbi:OmpA family protein [Jannaschia sp. M317]|nr:OmpA family protein [Jannaschia sp. M317]